jgi:chemotaxis protein CheD
MIVARPPKPICLTNFDHINRYWDQRHATWAAKILPGELYVSTNKQEALCTTLGSCVAACIRDKENGIGGINHFMLPVEADSGSSSWMNMATRYGSYAMEHLINEILKAGGRRENLEMKVCGGAKVIESMGNVVGQRNIDFVLEYAHIEGLDIVASDLGDKYPRKVMYYPATGRLRIKRLRKLPNDTLVIREKSYVAELDEKPITGDVELF